MSKHHNRRYNNDMEDKEKDKLPETTPEVKSGEPVKTEQKSSGNYQQKSEPVRKSIEVKPNPVVPVNMSNQTPQKRMNGKVIQLNQLVKTYLDKCAEFDRTKSNAIKLYSHFWNIAQYVLESRSREVMDAFFEKFVHNAYLHDEKYALRMIYELKDQILRTKISIFWQIHNQLKRFFAERGTCYISIKSVSLTFDGFPEFADWVNLKKNR